MASGDTQPAEQQNVRDLGLLERISQHSDRQALTDSMSIIAILSATFYKAKAVKRK